MSRRKYNGAPPVERPSALTIPMVASAAKMDNSIQAFERTNITFSGEISDYDYTSILRDKQQNIKKLFELSDYFTDADAIFRGIIKGVLVPFSVADGYKLIGGTKKTRDTYEEYFERIGLADKLISWFLQYYKYENLFTYLMDDGNIISLPVHKVDIASVSMTGEPIIEFDISSLRMTTSGGAVYRKYIDDTQQKEILRGFPKEVSEALLQNKGVKVQMNPEFCFAVQGLKEDWVKYAVPVVAACLPAFAKKALISQFENAMLNFGAKGFLHVQVGDPTNKVQMKLDQSQLDSVDEVFSKALKGGKVATTNCYVKSEFKVVDTDELFDNNKYQVVNEEILSAGGIAGLIVTGDSEGGSFAQATVSLQTCAERILAAQRNMAEMINKVMKKLNDLPGSAIPHGNPAKMPVFTFNPIDISKDSKFYERVYKLWQEGVASTETLMEAGGLDIAQEIERRTGEKTSVDTVLTPRQLANQMSTKAQTAPSEEDAGGRPAMDDTERSSDKNKSATGKQPKPSAQ